MEVGENSGVVEDYILSSTRGSCVTNFNGRLRVVFFSGDHGLTLISPCDYVDPTSMIAIHQDLDKPPAIADETLHWWSRCMERLVARGPGLYYSATMENIDESLDVMRMSIVEIKNLQGGDDVGEIQWQWRWMNRDPGSYWLEQPADIRRLLDNHNLQPEGTGPYIVDSKLYLFQHDSNQAFVEFDQVFVYDLDSKETCIHRLEGDPTHGIPSQRTRFSTCVQPDDCGSRGASLCMVGGRLPDRSPCAEVWRFSFTDLRWTMIDARLEVPVFDASSVALCGGRLFIFGGDTLDYIAGWEEKLIDRLQEIVLP